MTNQTPLIDWMNDKLIKRGTWKGVEWALVRGRGDVRINGYVYLPEGHPWREEDDFYARNDIDVHGGITFGKGGWIGFDTSHAFDSWGDDPEMDAALRADKSRIFHWTEAKVATEVRRLAAQVAEAKASPAPPVLPDDVAAAKETAWGEWVARYGEWYMAEPRKVFDAAFGAAYLALRGGDK